MTPWPFSRNGMVLDYRREGGSLPPDHETLVVSDDGGFELWRTVTATSPIGRFRGRVPADRWTALRKGLDACRRVAPVHLALPPDAAREKVTVGKQTSTWAEDAEPPPPFGTVADMARLLVQELTTFPEAAIALDLGGTASLAHRGRQELELDLSGTSLRAVRWDGGLAAESWEQPVRGPRSVTAGAGWTYQLPFAHPFGASAQVSAAVDNLLAFDGEFWRSCSLQAPAR